VAIHIPLELASQASVEHAAQRNQVAPLSEDHLFVNGRFALRYFVSPAPSVLSLVLFRRFLGKP
jgi:hypothetical protein